MGPCTPTDCRVSLAMPEDTEAVLALYRAASSTPGSSWTEDYPSREFVTADVSRGSLYCLWGEKGQLLGAASGGEPDEDIRDLPCWDHTARQPWELCRVGVHPDCQGRGLAKVLVRHILEDAARRGTDSVRLLVSRDNPPAVALYRQLGFVTVGTCRMYETDWFCQELQL